MTPQKGTPSGIYKERTSQKKQTTQERSALKERSEPYHAISLNRVEGYDSIKQFVEMVCCFKCNMIPLSPQACSSCDSIICGECLSHGKVICPDECTEQTYTPSLRKNYAKTFEKVKVACKNQIAGCN